jgi:uncharacterized membrane protein YjdF
MLELNLSRWKVHQTITILLKLTLLIGVTLALYQGRYQAAVETLAILCITFLPLLLGKRYNVRIPHEFELLAIVFIYASLFLGEVHGYYARFWWWDIVLHTGSGFLLGVLGFLLVYVLNENDNVNLDLAPGFMALFAFAFALAFGALWEIFEFTMDHLFGLQMQKPMFGDPSGLTDTMWDLIVDAIGALIITILGYGYLRTTSGDSFLEKWIDKFIDKNPQFFSGERK